MMWLVGLLVGVSLLSFLCGIAAVFAWAVPRLERTYVFRPMRDIFKTPLDFGIPFRQLEIETPDNCRLAAWHMTPPQPRASILYFHGNTGNLGLFNEVFELLYRNGFEVFAIDYRGYGMSSGVPSEEGLHRDARAAAEFFTENLRVPDRPVVYWGRSLGGCFAASASRHFAPQGLILETAFPSKKSLMSHFPQFRFFYLFSRYRLDTARHLKGHRFPVLVIHGDRDRTIPHQQGELLFQNLTGPKEFFSVQGADHINIHRTDHDRYMERILCFVDSLQPESRRTKAS